MGFFVQSILADRYIHRREMRVVSLKISSSKHSKLKRYYGKDFFDIRFFEELSKFKVFF